MSWAHIEDHIRGGHGQGWQDHYLAWLLVRRGHSSTCSMQLFGSFPGYKRGFNFLSLTEYVVALVVKFLGAMDINEQCPYWPGPHLHRALWRPGITLKPGVAREHPGLLEVARKAGLDHGFFGGAPYVATTDLAVWVQDGSATRICGIAVKPFAFLEQRKPKALERIELERVYQEALGEHHAVAHEELIGRNFTTNILFYRTGHDLPTSLNVPALIEDFCGILSEWGRKEAVRDALTRASKPGKLTLNQESHLYRWAVWHRRIDIDLTEPLDHDRPFHMGGARIYSRLSKHLLGVDVTQASSS